VQCRDCGSAFVATAAQDGVPSRTAAPAAQPTTAPLPPQAERPVSEDGQLVHPFLKPAPAPATELAEFSVVSPSIGAKRPVGLVWLVFYWLFAGLVLLYSGGICAGVGTFMGGGIGNAPKMFGPSNVGELGGQMLLMEFMGVLLFHYGLLLMVACYGLWTFRRWGLSLARGLAIAFVVVNILCFVIALVYRTGIVVSVVGVFISAGIVVYLYGSANLRDHLQRYIRTNGLRGDAWSQYK
jgi:hypothetical protein